MSGDTLLTIVTLQDMQSVEFEMPIRDLREVDCRELASVYQNVLKELDQSVQPREFRVYRLMHQLCWLHFRPTDRAEPFGPMMVVDGKRSAIPSDFRGEQNEVIAEVAPTITNPALRARLADIAWYNDRKKADCGRLAVRSYVECIERLLRNEATLQFDDDNAWDVTALEMLRRALIIANALGRDKPDAELARDTAEKVREAAKAHEDLQGFYRAAELTLDFGLGSADALGLQLESMAATTLASGHFPFAAELYKEAERAFGIARDAAGEERCAVSVADCYVAWADACKGSAMNESHWLQEAIAKLRRIRGTRERRDQLQQRMVAVQANIRDEMGTFETEIDLTDLVDRARTAVKGRSLIRAFAEFAQLDRSRRPEELRAAAQKTARGAPLFAMMGASTHDVEGKVVAKSPGMIDHDGADDAGLQRLILHNESHHRHITANGLIDPARQLIQSEHPVEQLDLLPLMGMSPFVPPDRELIFARAFARFFGGDSMSAIHLLFPQLENSLRSVLKQSGFDATSIKPDMTQQDMTIAVMLDGARPELERIFGPAIVLEIDNLFNVRAGPSIRHSAAHGLFGQGAFWSADVIYACWFIFRLCLLPLLSDWERVERWYESVFNQST